MSTEAIEAPTETQPPAREGAYTPLADLIRNATAGMKLPDPKPDEKPADAPVLPVEQKVVAPPDQKPPEQVKPKRTDFERVEQRASAAERERDAAVAERAASQKKIDDMQARLAEYQANSGNTEGLKAAITEKDQKIRQLEEALRSQDLRHDPEFQERFETGLKFHTDRLTEIGSEVLDKAEVERLIRKGDDERLAEIRESLPIGKRAKWDASIIKIEELSSEKDQLLQRSEETWKKLQDKRRSESIQGLHNQTQQHMGIGMRKIDDIFEKVPTLGEDTELRAECVKVVRAVSGLEGAQEWTPERMMETMIMKQVYGKILQAQDATLKGLTEERDELQKENERINAVLKKKGLSASGDDSENFTAEPRNGEKYVPMADRIVGPGGYGR